MAAKEKKFPVDPVGYQLLIKLRKVPEKSEGGIILTPHTTDVQKYSTVVGEVIKLGPTCYKDTARMGDVPWCKEGDWVLLGKFVGQRYSYNENEYRIINDDMVRGTVNNVDEANFIMSL